MRILISWSNERSRLLAEALRDWLPLMFQSVTPWMSAADIQPGTRWATELAHTLENTDFGILCLTPENTASPWILFEAGALSKSLKGGLIVPYLYGLKPEVLDGPLAQFQAVTADETGTRNLVETIAELSCHSRRSAAAMGRVFDKWWPELKSRIEQISVNEHAQPAQARESSIETDLEEFKERFEETDVETAFDLLLEGENILLRVIDKDRYDALQAGYIPIQLSIAKAQVAKNADDRAEAELQMDIALRSLNALKKRIKGIKYHTK